MLSIVNNTRKGWCPRTGKGQQFMSKDAVNVGIEEFNESIVLATALQTLNFRFLNFQETLFKA